MTLSYRGDVKKWSALGVRNVRYATDKSWNTLLSEGNTN